MMTDSTDLQWPFYMLLGMICGSTLKGADEVSENFSILELFSTKMKEP